jgi:beta-glucosidase-like glycosyl hydrolase
MKLSFQRSRRVSPRPQSRSCAGVFATAHLVCKTVPISRLRGSRLRSYNAVNGVPTCLDDKAQNGFLRAQLGYKGLIVSDCDAVGDAFSSHHYSSSAAEASAQGIKAGCDQDCGSTYKQSNLATAIDSGNLTIKDVDLALGRIMTMRFNLGMFDPAGSIPYTTIGNDVLNNAHGQALALAAACVDCPPFALHCSRV